MGPMSQHDRVRRRSRAQSIPLPDAVTGADGQDATVVEAIMPGLDFCNHSAAPACRWRVSQDSKVS